MATATQITSDQVSMIEYLNTAYRPDVEFVDGVLKGRSVVNFAHGRLQWLIGSWFDRHEDEWSIVGAVEVRTRVSPTRVRLPDVIIDRAGVKPSTLVDPPLIVIEILSPDDTYTETQRLAQDYLAMGIQNIWLIDPETRTGRSCEGNAWIEVKRFQVAESPIYLDLGELFARLNRNENA